MMRRLEELCPHIPADLLHHRQIIAATSFYDVLVAREQDVHGKGEWRANDDTFLSELYDMLQAICIRPHATA